MDSQKTYNIVWADDDIDTLVRKKENIDFLKSPINLIGKCHNSAELKDFLQNSSGRVDAVIVDANFSKRGDHSRDENDLSGLSHVTTFIESFQSGNKALPFYMFTQRLDIGTKVNERDMDIDYFIGHDAIFYKDGGLEPLLTRIKRDIDRNSDTGFWVRNHFCTEIEYAKRFDSICGFNEAERFVTDNLIMSVDNSWEQNRSQTQDQLNNARKIIERIMNYCKKTGIVPSSIKELNAFSKFLNGQTVKVDVSSPNEPKSYRFYMINKGEVILPKPLGRSLWYYLDIVQDGSHTKADLELHVSDYIARTNNVNIFRAILYLTIDLIKWFIDYYCANPNKASNESKWDEYIEDPTIHDTKC